MEKMEKVRITFSEYENVFLKFNNQKIEIRPYLKMAEQVELINKYLENYLFGNSAVSLSAYDFVGAELQLMLTVIDLLTNIEVADNDGNLLVNEGDVVVSGLWDEIKSKIDNYVQFRELLDRVVEDVKYQIVLQHSIGTVINGVVEKANVMIDKLTSMDITPETIEKIKEMSKEVTENIGKNPVVAEAFKEAGVLVNGGKRRGRKPKSNQ